MKRKFTCLLFAALFALCTFATAQAAPPSQDVLYNNISQEEQMAIDAEVDAIHGENFSANEREALSQSESMYEDFMRTRAGDTIFPDFYGGSYIGYDGQLVIHIVNSYVERAHVHDSVGSLLDDGVMYKVVEHSRNDLFAVQDTINDIFYEGLVLVSERASRSDWCIYLNNMILVSANVMANHVVVRLAEYNYDMVAGFRRYVYDSPMLVFEHGPFII